MPRSMEPEKPIPIALPTVGEPEWQALRSCFESGWLTQGPQVRAFEQAFAKAHGVPHAIATTSCTTALHLALTAMGIGPGDEVIVPAFTWVATANVVFHCGATPVLADVDPSTFNLDPAGLPALRSERTRAVIPVHLFGLCADVPAVRELLPGVAILEDAACAVGARLDATPAGGLGDAGAFSFHPRKTLTTGEGGMVTTGDPELAERMVRLRNHGASVSEEERHHGPQPYRLPDFDVAGFNYRMTDLQGAVGRVQLQRLEELLAGREKAAAFYADSLADLEWLHTPRPPAAGRHGWQSYVCLVDESRAPLSRNRMMERLQERGIATRPGTHALPTLGVLRERLGCRPEDFPGALLCAQTSLALPLHNRMSDADYQRVADALHELES